MYRLLVTGGITAMLLMGLAGPVLGATPSNDLYADRSTVPALPFAASVDTTEATTEPADAEGNAQCGAPATDASVWYELTPSTDGTFLVDVSGSDYSAGFLVVIGSPGSFEAIACGPGGGSFFGAAGVAYGILLFDDQLDGVGIGGQLELSITVAPPPPELTLTVDPTGLVNARTGVATIHGTLMCSGEASIKDVIGVEVTQTIGRFRFTGGGGGEFTCDGTPRPWSVDVSSQNGKFAGGKAQVSVSAFACTETDCGSAFVDDVTVRLHR